MGRTPLGERIRFLREGSRLTQRELGDRLGVTDKVVSHWEAGRSNPAAADIPGIARALSVTISELYGVEPPSEEELQATGLLALKVDDYRTLTDEDWRMVREFIEYRIAVRKSEQRNREEASDGAA